MKISLPKLLTAVRHWFCSHEFDIENIQRISPDCVTSNCRKCGIQKRATCGLYLPGKLTRVGHPLRSSFLISAVAFISICCLPSVCYAQPSPPGFLRVTNASMAFVSAKPKTNTAYFVAYWKPSPDTNVAAYNIAWGINSNTLNNSTQVGKSATSVTVSNVQENVLLYMEILSVDSNNVSSFPEKTSLFMQPRWRTGTLTTYFDVTVPAGRSNLIESSTDGINWKTILTNKAGGEIRIIRTNGVGVMEFFRVK